MIDYECMGKTKIRCENGFEKYAKGKKWEPKQNFVSLEAIFNVFRQCQKNATNVWPVTIITRVEAFFTKLLF